MNSVAIVGAGITGLVAAFRLQQKNIPVTLYEAGDRVGGVIQTLRENGFLAEYGPNSILETSPTIAEIISDLCLDSRRRDADETANTNYIVRDGRMQPLPMTPLRFAATRLFSTAAKLRLAAEPFIRTPPRSEDESLADFVVRRLGKEFLTYAINPFVSGIYAGDAAKLSVRHAFPKLHAVEEKYGSLILGQILGARERSKRKEVSKQRAKKVSFDDGLQVLTDTLCHRLGNAVELHSQVTGIRKHTGGWTVLLMRNGHEEMRQHSAVLLTAPAYKIADIRIEDLPGMSLAPLAKIEHPQVARIVFGFRREDVADPLDGFGFLVPEIERLNILGTTFSSSCFANRAPESHVTLTTFLGGTRNPELAALDPDTLFDLTLRDLQRILGVRGKPVYQHHAFFPKAIPQYNVGYGEFKRFMTETEERLPGLFFAGNYRDGISVGNSMVAGQEIAGRIAAFLPSTVKPREASPPA